MFDVDRYEPRPAVERSDVDDRARFREREPRRRSDRQRGDATRIRPGHRELIGAGEDHVAALRSHGDVADPELDSARLVADAALVFVLAAVAAGEQRDQHRQSKQRRT